MTIAVAMATLLEKAAADNGFDRPEGATADWLAFTSTQAPLGIWLSVAEDGRPIAAFSMGNVAHAIGEQGVPARAGLPAGAVSARLLPSIPALHPFLRRAFQLSRTLPDELLHTFEKATAGMARATEAERLVVQRVGQDVFREGLMEYWDGRCAVTGLAVRELLRASHIKPWADCDTDAERLDVYNGLLLAPHLDAAFDQGFITVAGDGEVLVSTALTAEARRVLGLEAPLRVAGLAAGHRAYLPWHRERIFTS